MLLLAALAASGGAQQTKRNRDVVAECQSQFGMDMYSLMASKDKTSNIFFSPTSIATVLAMTYAGSRGETEKQLKSVLHLEGRKPTMLRGHRGLLKWMQRKYKKGVSVKMTNRLYAAKRLRLRPKFSSFMERVFMAQMTKLDFRRPRQAAERINENVKKDTAGNIDDLISPRMLSALTQMVLVNAIYFKGDWLMKFERENTTMADFHTLEGTKQVHMMKTKKMFPVGTLYEMDARILELPYKGENINMMILLPNERDGIQALEEKLAEKTLLDLSWNTAADEEVEVQLPRFKMEERINLKAVLQEMGIEDLFDADKADLTRISGPKGPGGLHVTDAVHKAVIEVNEEGTEASAATGLAFGFRMLRPKPEPFIVDRPFVFAIRDVQVGATLFMGRVMDPEA